MIERAADEKRVESPASKIVLGLNCGGSDSFSGITANPALGVCSDLLAEISATSVLAETTEIFGAEHLLVKRARNREVAEKLLAGQISPTLQTEAVAAVHRIPASSPDQRVGEALWLIAGSPDFALQR